MQGLGLYPSGVDAIQQLSIQKARMTAICTDSDLIFNPDSGYFKTIGDIDEEKQKNLVSLRSLKLKEFTN